MCDQNIAVSIRTLNQMSSIIPNRMEKLKLSSLAAGIVAGFTTDCNYSEDVSLAKGYDSTVVNRVNDLANVLKDYIVLNRTWYDTGARTISDMRNIFVTGRRHPINTLGNVFSVITRIENSQANSENGAFISAARDVLVKYGLNLDVPLYRLINESREKGLVATITTFREGIIKSAKRITSTGERLDILDDEQLSKVTSVIAGILIGYTEPLPSTQVDFEQYYLGTALPFGMSMTNGLVEKMLISTDALLAAFRSTIETRYEIMYEPVAILKGLVGVIVTNDVFAEVQREAIRNCNRDELLQYIVKMVKGVYDVRKEALERATLHEFDYLPITNPISGMLNRPESHDDIQKRVEELAVSTEAISLGKARIKL